LVCGAAKNRQGVFLNAWYNTKMVKSYNMQESLLRQNSGLLCFVCWTKEQCEVIVASSKIISAAKKKACFGST